MDALLLLVPRGRARGYTRPGDFFLAAEGATPAWRGEAAAAPMVYTGAAILAPSVFAVAPSGPFPLWQALTDWDRVAAVTYAGDWVDVGTPAGLAEAEAALKAARQAAPE
jgi:MurNAc alpha-1-phosphate uridylyltransferase